MSQKQEARTKTLIATINFPDLESNSCIRQQDFKRVVFDLIPSYLRVKDMYYNLPFIKEEAQIKYHILQEIKSQINIFEKIFQVVHVWIDPSFSEEIFYSGFLQQLQKYLTQNPKIQYEDMARDTLLNAHASSLWFSLSPDLLDKVNYLIHSVNSANRTATFKSVETTKEACKMQAQFERTPKKQRIPLQLVTPKQNMQKSQSIPFKSTLLLPVPESYLKRTYPPGRRASSISTEKEEEMPKQQQIYDDIDSNSD